MPTAQIEKIQRNFLPEDFALTDWDSLEPYMQKLLDAETETPASLEQWLKNVSEMEAVVSEDVSWRQIKMTCDTENPDLEAAFVYFCTEIQPPLQEASDKLNRKLMASPAIGSLDKSLYGTYLRTVGKNIELFRQENVPIFSEMNVLQQKYGAISGKMTVEVDGKEYTLKQAARFLEDSDRSVRETVYRKIQERRLRDKEELNALFDDLVKMRHQVALNAGFDNFRDYKFKELGRFDYGKEDCFLFHDAVATKVLPLVEALYEQKRKTLNLDRLRPWDLEAEPVGTLPLRPFTGAKELIDKTIECFQAIDPFFADCLRTMDAMGRFDLESRKGKAPGGYNCPLAETGAPFVFMNASGVSDDVTTMLHEGGHAVHSFLAHPLSLTAFKEYPMEIAEVASMAMELMSMDHWDVFYPDKEDLRRAKEQHLERLITLFPWIAIIDKFQHWIYEHPGHGHEARARAWTETVELLSPKVVDYSGLEAFREAAWQKQLHLYEVPFYYIEYGIAQLGAIGLWKQYKENPSQAVGNYIRALSLGGTKPLPELYEAADLKFDLSPAHIGSLMAFVQQELNSIAGA